MGYEIIYNTFTVEKNGVYIPFVVQGSSNCFEVFTDSMGRERQRRERYLTKADNYFVKQTKIRNGKTDFESLDQMDEHFDLEGIQDSMDGGMLQGRYSTAKGMLRSFKKYVFDYTEVPTEPHFKSLYYIDTGESYEVTDEEKSKIRRAFEPLNDTKEILTRKEELEIINNSLDKLPDDLEEKVLNWRSKKTLVEYWCDRDIENL